MQYVWQVATLIPMGYHGTAIMAARSGREEVLLDLITWLTCTECGGRLDFRVHVPRLAKFGGRA
jgi:predicted metal-binding protein